MKTKLTKTGQPVMGTTIEVRCVQADGPYWERCKVVAKGWGKGPGAPLVMLTVEWADGVRQSLDYEDMRWREHDGGDT